MNELIKIKNQNGKQLVSARELHEFLGVKRYFTQWLEPYIKKDNDYGFEKNVDFIGINVDVNPTNGVPIINYALTINMAKELSMLSKTEKGKQARNYFIQCEEKMKENVQALNTSELSPELQMFKQIFDTVAKSQLEQKQLRKDINDTKDQLQGIRDVVSINTSTINWREDCRKLIVRIAHKLGGNSFIGDVNKEVYELMRIRLKVRLDVKLTNLRRRMAEEGVCKSKRDKMNYLDVIKDDSRLIEGYVSIVKELAIKYGVDKEAM